jgi:transcriptional regulator with XRE-family HTH domain
VKRLSDYDDLRQILHAEQIRRGPSHSELARRTGMSRQQVGDWLGGNAGAGARRVFALTHALGYDLALVPREDTL